MYALVADDVCCVMSVTENELMSRCEIDVAQGMMQWWAFVKTVWNLGVP
jgi:hypothetical protein